MTKSVLLPFCMPFFANGQHNASVGLAMFGHPTAYNAVLNQCLSIGCCRRFLRGYTAADAYIPSAGLYDFDFIEKYSITGRFGVSFYKEGIKRMLDEGYYVYFYNFDDYYIPGKSWYGIRHMPHNGIVCGYDEHDNTFSIASYNTDWIFSLYRAPQDSVIEAAEACFKNKEYSSITGYKIKPGVEVKLDVEAVLKRLKQYLAVTIDKISLDCNDGCEGIATHDLLSMYVGKLKDGSISPDKMDWRALRPVWEHKRVMLDRIKAVEDVKGWNSELSDRYAPLVDYANRLRGMYAIYHKNRKVSLLDKISTGLISLREKEYDILQDFVKKMEAPL